MKKYFYFIFLIIFILLFKSGILSSSLIFAQNDIPCTYVYGEWGACSDLGIETRNYNATPTGCYQLDPPVAYQTCTSTAAISTTPCYYTYSDWSACNTNGYQTRTVVSKYPTECHQATYPVLYQTCNYVPASTVPCLYTYGDWSSCVSGIQTRNYNATPTGCHQLDVPVIRQTCTSTAAISTTPCYYTYSDWTDCNQYGYQTRTVVSKYPTECQETMTAIFLERDCLFAEPIPTTTNSTETAEKVISVLECKYEYSAWSDCISDRKMRMVIARSPQGCSEVTPPVLYQACKSVSQPVETAIPADAPVPAPESVLVQEASDQTDFNGKTSSEWQKYYFGSESCKKQSVCGGLSDPDNDGLSNNEEYRFGTNPRNPDTDHDGYVDADEIQNGRNPLVASSTSQGDKMTFESPRETGEVRQDLYSVNNVEMVETLEGNSVLKITGKALPDIYVTIYIYSDPIILTIKTDSDGNWTYTLDNPLNEGEHQVYVVVTDNVGKIVAKSEPIVFIQTAEAAIITSLPAIGVSDKNEVSPTKAWFKGSYSIFIILGILGLVIALTAIGLTRTSANKPDDYIDK